MRDLTILHPEWLLDDPPSPPRRNRVVVVRGAKIEGIAAADAPDLPAGAIVRLPGRTLMPGLIDAHAHLTLCGCLAPRQTMMRETNDLLLLRAAENARTALLAGITTVRDCGDRDGITFALREAIESGIAQGPSLTLSGPPLTAPRGHCYFMGGEVEGRDQIAWRIGDLDRRGADFIKVMATGGGLTPGTDSLALQFPEEELAFIVSEAARRSLYVAAHAHSPVSIRACLDAGVRTIEHASFVSGEGIHAEPAILAAMSRQKALAVPTNIPAVNAVREGRTLGLARELGLTSEQFLEGRTRVLRALLESGVPVIAGSDAGATGVPFTALIGEVALLAESSSNLRAIAAATSESASGLGLSGVGRIAPGFAADLLAVRGNPAENIEALRDAEFVMRRGRIVLGGNLRREP